MSDIIKFPPRPKPGIIASFIQAMGPNADHRELYNNIHRRQAQLLAQWRQESVEHLGPETVRDMLESVLAHMKLEGK